jgi:lysophospholipase L1-like esterase
LRFFGVDLALEHPRGITLDTLGINGAKARDFLSQSDSFFADAQRLLAPKLVVFAFGTNESGDSHAVDDHRQAIEALVTKMRGAMPKAACLLLGPMDRAGAGRGPESTLPKIPLIDEAQRQAAQRLGCAYYSQFRAMGGAGSMAAWSSEPIPRRARTDRVHLTERGYVLLGNGFAEGLLHGFEQWNASPK